MTTTRWAQAPGVLSRHTTTGVIILPPGADGPIGLTGWGAALWNQLTSPVDMAEITDLLARKVGSDEEQSGDVHLVLTELARCGAVRRSS